MLFAGKKINKYCKHHKPIHSLLHSVSIYRPLLVAPTILLAFGDCFGLTRLDTGRHTATRRSLCSIRYICALLIDSFFGPLTTTTSIRTPINNRCQFVFAKPRRFSHRGNNVIKYKNRQQQFDRHCQNRTLQ